MQSFIWIVIKRPNAKMQEGRGNNSFLGLSQLVCILQEGNSYSRRYENVPGSRVRTSLIKPTMPYSEWQCPEEYSKEYAIYTSLKWSKAPRDRTQAIVPLTLRESNK